MNLFRKQNKAETPANNSVSSKESIDRKQPPVPESPRRRILRFLISATFFVATFLVLRSILLPEPVIENVELSEIVEKLESGEVVTAAISDSKQTITITLKESDEELTANYPLGYARDLTDKILEANVELEVDPPTSPNPFVSLLYSLIPVLIILGVLLFLLRKSAGLGGLGKLSSKKTNPVEVPETRFKDVAGADEALADLQEAVELLNDPQKFEKTGAKPPRGFLLIGPPGTGKTLLARAVAGEAGVPFFAISGSDFVEMFVGLGASRVRELFEKARSQEKAIIFIDEIDAIGKKRSGSSGFINGNDERENTLNQLLVEMDGFTQSGIVMIAATNRPDTLDPALTRPGRFDRKIIVPPPDRKGRIQMMELYAKDKPFSDKISWDSYAKRIPGMTGADIAALINEAALEAARNNSETIEPIHVESALQTTVLGRERKSAHVTKRDREIVAWHEAGHATVALILDKAADPVQVTIVPRGVAGGVTWMSGSEDDFLTKNQALHQLAVSMGGRAAEEVLLKGDYTQGAHGDLQSATALATTMVTKYGMGEHLVSLDKEKSFNTLDQVDKEVSEYIKQALDLARSVVAEYPDLLKDIVDNLLENESIDHDTLLELRLKHVPDFIEKDPSLQNSEI